MGCVRNTQRSEALWPIRLSPFLHRYKSSGTISHDFRMLNLLEKCSGWSGNGEGNVVVEVNSIRSSEFWEVSSVWIILASNIHLQHLVYMKVIFPSLVLPLLVSFFLLSYSLFSHIFIISQKCFYLVGNLNRVTWPSLSGVHAHLKVGCVWWPAKCIVHFVNN